MLRLPKAAPDVGIEALLWQPPSPKALEERLARKLSQFHFSGKRAKYLIF
jgi:hypothetical protein